jgi:ABC-type anion transport system duplicated permease subunit
VSNPSHAEDYPSTVSGAKACPSVNADGAVLAPGAACVYSLSFIPVVAGNPISSSLVVTDNSLNAHNATQTVALTGIGLPPPDTTTVTVVATPASVDQGKNSSVVVTVADSVNPGSVPTGTVTVMDGSFTLAASAALTNGAVSLSYTPDGGGAHTISASYSPTNSTVYQNSAGNGTLQVLPAGTTTTTLAVISGGSQVSSVVSGSAIKLTATVLAACTPVTAGQVNFCDAAAAHCADIHLLGTAQLTNAGTASIRFTPGVGVYSYKAVFVGTSNLSTTASSASPLTVTGSVGSGPYATATTIATSGNVGAYSLTATVTGTGSFTHAVTGTISFLDASHSNAVLGTQALGASTLGLNFANAQTLSGGSAGVAVGDFNGDGKLDMAVTNSNDATLHIYLGVGGGTFTAGQVISIGNGSSAIAVGDFNGDGKLDLATAYYGDNTVTVLLGNGNGTFTATGTSPGTGAGPNGIATGDFNGDGNADLAVANSVDGTVTILHGDGLGGFTAVSTPSVGNWPVSIAVGDFNHDGNLDLAVANLNGNTVTILLGAGNGTFTAAAASPVTGNGPSFIVAGDFNGDGKIDLATANQNDNTVTVLLGNNDGSFAPTVASPASGSNPLALAVADFNHDGKVDLAVTNYNDSTVTVLLGNGDGTFTLAASPSTGLANSDPQGIAIGDFNGDGYPDIVATNANFQNAAVLVMHPELSTETATAAVSNIAILGTGTHNAEASYPGDSNYSSSISSTTGLTAQPSATTITLGASPSSSTYGTTVVLTATLNPFTAGAASSDGEPVTFYNRTTNLGTAILSNGVAALSLSTLPAEAASLTAVYGGDTNLATSSSTALPFTIAPSTAAITFNVASQIYGVAPIAVGATSASSGAFTYAVVSGPATVSGSTVTVSGIGTVVLSATQAASGNYATNSQNTTFTVAAATPTITFNVANQTYGVAPIAVAATSASSGAFTYAVVSGPAAVSGSTVTVSGIGTVILSATQAAGGNYASNTQNACFSVAAATPTITFNVANQTYGVAPNALAATLASSGAFTYAVVSGPATVSGSTLTVSGISTVVLSATQAAGGNYASNTQNASFTVAVATPTITFNVANQTYGVAPIALAATSASSGSFTYAVVSGPAAISGSTVTVSGIGTVVLSATQVASGNYASNTQNAAFTVAAATPTITFNVASQTYGVAPIALAATSASSGAFTYTVVSGPATVSGSTVTVSGIGTVVLSVTQAASGNYASNTQNASFTVAAVTSMITFNVANQTYGVAPIALAATSASSGVFTYAVVSGPASISGSFVTVSGIGTVVLSAMQAASGNYASNSQNSSFTVVAEMPLLAFSPIPSQTTNSVPFSVNASSASTGAITYAVVSGPATVSGSTVTVSDIGTVVLSATQAASGNYVESYATTSFVVDSGFTVTPISSSGSGGVTIPPGGTATYGMALAPGSGTTFPHSVTFAATGVPPGATATFSRLTIPAGSGPTSVTLTIHASDNQASIRKRPLPLGPMAPLALALLLPMMGMKRVRKHLLNIA